MKVYRVWDDDVFGGFRRSSEGRSIWETEKAAKSLKTRLMNSYKQDKKRYDDWADRPIEFRSKYRPIEPIEPKLSIITFNLILVE